MTLLLPLGRPQNMKSETYLVFIFWGLLRGRSKVIKCKKLKVFKGSHVVYQMKGLDE
jgi:hypothetical protein